MRSPWDYNYTFIFSCPSFQLSNNWQIFMKFFYEHYNQILIFNFLHLYTCNTVRSYMFQSHWIIIREPYLSLLSCWLGCFFFPMPPHVLMNFRGFPPGCGDSVADFWGWDAHEARLRCSGWLGCKIVNYKIIKCLKYSATSPNISCNQQWILTIL